MRTIPAKAIYIDPAVREQPNCRRRLEAMLPQFDFAVIWRERNRPSRLRDNLKAIRRAINQTAKPAR